METFESSFATEIGRVQDVFYGVPSSDQKAFVAKTLGPYSTTEHLRSVKVNLSGCPLPRAMQSSLCHAQHNASEESYIMVMGFG